MKIKKIEKVWTDVDLEEIVDHVFDKNLENSFFSLIDDLDYVREVIEDDLDSDEYDLSNEEKKDVMTACEEKFNYLYNKYKEEEINKLNSREKIINFIDSYISNDEWKDLGDIGYILSAEEILDLIVENCNH